MDFDDIPPADDAPPLPVPEPLLPDPEPEDSLSEFNRKFTQIVEDRRSHEYEVEKQHKVKASEDLSHWATQRQARLNAKKEKNRSEEQVLLESIESEIEGVNPWDRVTKLVDLSTESTDAKKADVTRFKKLLIQLKNDPIKSN